jgi:LAS superfamily LD-carboxypeptidase LdcB
LNDAELTGQADSHVAAVDDPPCQLHAQVVAPFLNLRRAARAEGIDLAPASSFRDFARQLSIWNGKFSGERPMQGADGASLDPAALTPRERIDAILLWSALPGASRHHWGTDLDLVDRKAGNAGYRVKLTPEEFAPGGPFEKLDGWLTVHAPRFGFFRPFQGVRSGVRPEPWHFSFAPIAEKARQRLTTQVLRTALAGAPLLGKDIVLERLDELHARYVAAIDLP